MRDYIRDQTTGQCVAYIESGRDVYNRQEVKIATVVAGNLYDLENKLIGHLNQESVTGIHTDSMPMPFRKLVEG
jgi:hypothetical protein